MPNFPQSMVVCDMSEHITDYILVKSFFAFHYSIPQVLRPELCPTQRLSRSEHMSRTKTKLGTEKQDRENGIC